MVSGNEVPCNCKVCFGRSPYSPRFHVLFKNASFFFFFFFYYYLLYYGDTLPWPENGMSILDVEGSTTYGATATQSCKTGYTPSGTTTLSCLETGLWGDPNLTCTIKGSFVLNRID